MHFKTFMKVFFIIIIIIINMLNSISVKAYLCSRWDNCVIRRGQRLGQTKQQEHDPGYLATASGPVKSETFQNAGSLL